MILKSIESGKLGNCTQWSAPYTCIFTAVVTTCNNIPWFNNIFDHFGQLVNALESFIMWVVAASFPIF